MIAGEIMMRRISPLVPQNVLEDKFHGDLDHPKTKKSEKGAAFADFMEAVMDEAKDKGYGQVLAKKKIPRISEMQIQLRNDRLW